MSGRGGEQKLSVFYLANQLEPEHWAWAGADPAAAGLLAIAPGCDDLTQQQAVYTLTEHLVALLEAQGVLVEEAHAIIHDQDQVAVWHEAAQAEVLIPKAIHMHAAFKFAGGRQGGMTVANIAAALGVAEQQVEKPRKGGRAVEGRSASHDNQLAYLIHLKYTEKHQYAPERVATVRGEDFTTIHAKRRAEWLRGRAHVAKQRAAEDVEVLREKVIRGEVTESQIVLTDELYAVYARHKWVIDEALAVRAKREGALAAQRIGTTFRQANVFIVGASRAGKGVLADRVVGQCQSIALEAGTPWARHDAAGRHALEGASGAEVIYHDDARFYALPSYDEWLRYLDPNRSSEVAARFRNRPPIAPHLVVASSSETIYSFALAACLQKPPSDMAVDAKERTPVNIDEFLFRLGFVVEVTKPAGVTDPEVVAREMNVSIGRVVETDEAARIERVVNRSGHYLGRISTTHRIEPAAVIHGAERAARFLAVEVVANYADDVAQGLAPDALVTLLGDRDDFRRGELARRAELAADVRAAIAEATLVARRRDQAEPHARHFGRIAADGGEHLIDASGQLCTPDGSPMDSEEMALVCPALIPHFTDDNQHERNN